MFFLVWGGDFFFCIYISQIKNVCIKVCNWKAPRWKGRIRIWKVWIGNGNTSDVVRKAREDYLRLLKETRKGVHCWRDFRDEIQIIILPLSACLTLPKGYWWFKLIPVFEQQWLRQRTHVPLSHCGAIQQTAAREATSLILTDKFSRTDL